MITMSAAPARATASGSLALRMLSSAAIGMPRYFTRRRSSASSSIVPHGCSTYSRSNSVSAWIACSASSRFHAPFASMRMRPSGPMRVRTSRTRATSSDRRWPGSATLIFAVRQPSKRPRISPTAAASTAGTVAFTAMDVRCAVGVGIHP